MSRAHFAASVSLSIAELEGRMIARFGTLWSFTPEAERHAVAELPPVLAAREVRRREDREQLRRGERLPVALVDRQPEEGRADGEEQ